MKLIMWIMSARLKPFLSDSTFTHPPDLSTPHTKSVQCMCGQFQSVDSAMDQYVHSNNLSDLCIMDAHCFYVLPQMVTLQCMWYTLFVESGKLSALCLLLLQGGCFCGPPSLVSCYTPLLCYNCVFIHNLQRVCWQQQLISHSCRGGGSILF